MIFQCTSLSCSPSYVSVGLSIKIMKESNPELTLMMSVSYHFTREGIISPTVRNLELKYFFHQMKRFPNKDDVG